MTLRLSVPSALFKIDPRVTEMDEREKPRRAGKWQREVREEWANWAESDSSSRSCQLAGFASAVETAFKWIVRTPEQAIAVIDQLTPTLTNCDSLTFDDEAEAAAYLLWHLVDRYARVTESLDMLFQAGHLPVRKTRLSVLEVGCGPAPAVFAVRDYYADLAAWCEESAQPFSSALPRHISTLDRGLAWERVVHLISEAILQLPQRVDCPLPFAVTYSDLRGFSAKIEHLQGVERSAREIQAEFDLDGEYIDIASARQTALVERNYPPGSYDLIFMPNFLTNSTIVDSFVAEIEGLARSLTPGGALVVMGSASSTYDRVYLQLEQVARNLENRRPPKILDVALRAHSRRQVRDVVAEHVVGLLRHLIMLAPGKLKLARLPLDVQDLDPAKVTFPRFRLIVFKNQSSRSRTGEVRAEI